MAPNYLQKALHPELPTYQPETQSSKASLTTLKHSQATYTYTLGPQT